MKVHSEQRVLPYSAVQMFDLVADVGHYPEFLPWCTGARVRERKDDLIVADLMIGFKMVRERFTSRVHINRPELRIDVEYIDGPFKFLKNHWQFVDIEGGRCRVDFYLEFEFRSVMLQKLIGVLFHEAVRRMVSAFETRAKQLYG
ncbi:MAG TPA: type II toxin-antitoxin system RatA family toxin [Terriglobia bacterium]|nr:type II toxin-antitoxin system RatA family toxin [Terriglobia bacterium]